MENGKLIVEEGKVILFKKEKTKPTQPDFEGKLKVDGVIYRIVLWVKKKEDKLFMTGDVEIPKEFLSGEELTNEFDSMINQEI